MTLKLDSIFVITHEICGCKNKFNADGYIIRTRCSGCGGRGVKEKKISLIELKALLDGYSG